MWSLRWHFTNTSVTGASYNIKVTVCHTAGHCGEEYDDWNSAVFRSRRNCSSNGAEWTDGGRPFHAWAAATGKARSSSVVRHVDGTTSIDVEALRRHRREPTSVQLGRAMNWLDFGVERSRSDQDHILWSNKLIRRHFLTDLWHAWIYFNETYHIYSLPDPQGQVIQVTEHVFQKCTFCTNPQRCSGILIDHLPSKTI